MVEFIICDFESVRGGGNIKSDVPTINDFILENCTLEESGNEGEFILSAGISDVDSVSLSVSSGTVTVGGTVTLTAIVLDDEEDPLENKHVVFKTGSDIVGTGTTNSSGIATYTMTMNNYGTFTCTASCSGVTSTAVVVIVNRIVPTISLAAVSSTISVGDSPELTGTLSVGSGAYVRIIEGSTLVDTVITGVDGAFSYTGSATSSAGTLTFKAVSEGDSTYSSVESSTVSVTVGNKPVPTISLGASSSSITVGNSVTMSGQLVYGSTALSNASVKIYNGNTLVDTVSTNSQGYYTKSVSGLTVGTHSFTAVFEGDSSYASVTSTAVSVTVTSAPTPVPASISLTSDKSVLSYYDSESATLSATVLDSSSNPMSGETVSFDIVSGGAVVENIGTAQTNSSGVATVSYYAEGTGDISIQASVGMIVSETYVIEDCYYANTGTTSTLTIDTGVSCTIEDGAIKITKSTSGEKFVTCNYDYYNTNQEISFKVPKINSSTNVPLGFAVYRSDGSQIYWAGYSKSGGKFDSKGGSTTATFSAGDTIRIMKSGSTLTAYKGETSISSVSTATSGIRLAFYTNNNYIQYIDDIKVKPVS